MLDGEERIIEQAVAGDSSAFGALYDHYHPAIYRFVIIKVSGREEAEDITHQIFLSAWLNIRSYEHRGHPFSSWLYRIARNQIVDHYRSRRNETPIDAVDPEAFATPASVEAELPDKMLAEKALLAIRKLKPDYQDVVILRFVEDASLRETALALGKTEGAIKLMQHRAIKALKELLKDHGPFEDA